ncbi:uncharacterized [Tachysurus ichikawai]
MDVRAKKAGEHAYSNRSRMPGRHDSMLYSRSSSKNTFARLGWVPEASPELWHVEGGDKRKTALLRPY